MRYVTTSDAYNLIGRNISKEDFFCRIHQLRYRYKNPKLFKKLKNGRLLFDIDKHKELISYRQEYIKKAQEYYYQYICQPKMISEHCRRIAKWSEKYPLPKSWRSFFQVGLWNNNDENLLFLYQELGMAVEFVRYIETTYNKSA